MTDTADLRQRVTMAAANINRISADLAEAQADLDLLERLKSASDRVTRLTAELAKATKEGDRAIAAEAKATKAKLFSGITDVTVTESPKTANEGVLRSSWTIAWTKPTWDGRRTRPMQHSATGFMALSPEVLDYIIEERPDLIPAKIIALAPDSPREAFYRYSASIKRGSVIAR
jgi:hypothetical protein